MMASGGVAAQTELSVTLQEDVTGGGSGGEASTPGAPAAVTALTGAASPAPGAPPRDTSAPPAETTTARPVFTGRWAVFNDPLLPLSMIPDDPAQREGLRVGMVLGVWTEDYGKYGQFVRFKRITNVR